MLASIGEQTWNGSPAVAPQYVHMNTVSVLVGVHRWLLALVTFPQVLQVYTCGLFSPRASTAGLDFAGFAAGFFTSLDA